MNDNYSADEFVIVALGASAGGLAALEVFFKHMPSDAGIAFVIIQHLAPDHPTALPQLLGRHTAMPVEQAENNMPVLPNRVYIIPPKATLTIEKGTLCVNEPAEAHGARTPIDSFFSSLAQDRGEQAVCIMLSGTGTDGTQGLRAIKEYGGMAMAQTLDSAQYDSILRSAIATGLVDYVLTVEEMPEKLLNYAEHLASASSTPDIVRKQIAAQMNRVHAILRRRAGHDFSQYKENTIARRLERRMKALQIETVEQYVETLDSDPEEAEKLFNDLLIGVTQFFRDADAFKALQTEVIPKLFEGKVQGDHVRACVMGCSTGEEAYSIAILLLEYASTLKNPPKIQIFATDIDEAALSSARKGRYPASIAEHVSIERLERFFGKQDSAWQVNRELREIVLFSSHSFIKDPPFSRLDLISCRNVMIYLGQELQKNLIPLFHYALRPGGYLFLGPSESTASHKELFGIVEKRHRLFQRKETLPRPAVTFPVANVNRPRQPGARPSVPEAEERDLPKRLERIILERYRPACVTVKENGEAVYFSGRLGRYLEQPTGSPNVNVVNMAREGMRIPLRTALHRASTAHQRVVQKQISLRTNDGFIYVDLTVEPIMEFQAANLYMVIFEEVASKGLQPAPSPVADANSEEAIRHLEDELRSAQEHTQAMYEELESSNEELKSANEEYQSSNEELETSKEELQSFNEELQTVNSEITRKSTELDLSNSDLQNLLNSTEIATIFLDRELRIISFTPAAGAVFRLIAGDVGRPITDLAAQFADVDLVPEIRETLKTLKQRERQLVGTGARHYQLRVLPYRTVKNVIDGVVLTFTDVTQVKEAEEKLRHVMEFDEAVMANMGEGLYTVDAAGRVTSINPAAEKMFGWSFEELRGQKVHDMTHHHHPDGTPFPAEECAVMQVLTQGKTLTGKEDVFIHKNGTFFDVIYSSAPIWSGNEIMGLVVVFRDVTESKRQAGMALRHALQFENLFKEAPLGVYVVDADFRIQQVNLTARPVFGDIPDLVGRDFDEVIHILWPKVYADEIVERFRHTLATGEPYSIPERSEKRLDSGVAEYYQWQISRIQLPDERHGVVCYFWDISAHILARAAIADSREELRSVNESLRHFSYAASHDLQEPLRMVTTYTQLLAREYKGRLDPKADEFIAHAVEGAHRMDALLTDLREYWSVDEQQVEKLVPVDSNRVLETVLVSLKIPISETGAVVTHDPLPTIVMEEFPPVLLLQNLIGNSIKYRRPETAPRIHVSSQEEGDHWKITVSDNGLGIETEYLKTVFAPFKRLHGREVPGTGMGLAICQKIVERYGGRIWVESTHGQGSTFHFTLPAKNGDA